jgi:vanillate O-demethylase ferredoxin subunit
VCVSDLGGARVPQDVVSASRRIAARTQDRASLADTMVYAMKRVASMLKVRVERKTIEANEVLCFQLVAEDGGSLPAFEAGSHIDVSVTNNCIRQYSLCNLRGEHACYRICVKREPAGRGGSAILHDRVHVGSVLTVSEPKNHFPMVPEAGKSLLFAGGIGVTPIIAMAEHLAERRADFEMHYSTRSLSDAAFVQRLRESEFSDRVWMYHDDPRGPRLDLPERLRHFGPDTHLYVCGPTGYMDVVLATARNLGWNERQLHCEYFSSGNIDTSRDRAFEVVLASSGRVIDVQATQSIVQALAAEGVMVPVSCEQGVCGTCLTGVLEGEVDHRDLFLLPDEQARNDRLLPCCSRSISERLVLDL